jgi:hypothetical protein
MDINLLPESKKSNSSSAKIGSSIKKLSKLVLFIVLAGVLAWGGSTAYLSIQQNMFSSSKDKLESEVSTLQTTEQKMTLVRDRLKKSGRVLATRSAGTTTSLLEEIQRNLSPDLTIIESKLESDSLTLVMQTTESKFIGEFIRKYSNAGSYSRIDLVDATYDSEQKYTVELKMTPLTI